MEIEVLLKAAHPRATAQPEEHIQAIKEDGVEAHPVGVHRGAAAACGPRVRVLRLAFPWRSATCEKHGEQEWWIGARVGDAAASGDPLLVLYRGAIAGAFNQRSSKNRRLSLHQRSISLDWARRDVQQPTISLQLDCCG